MRLSERDARRLPYLIAGACTLALVSSLLGRLGDEAEEEPGLVRRAAVFHAQSDGDSATSPVAGNFAVGANGRPKSFRGTMLLQQGAVEVHYAYVGNVLSPELLNSREWRLADVYVVNVIIPDGATVTVPVVYRGGDRVILDHGGIRIVLGQEDRALTKTGVRPGRKRRSTAG